MYINILGIIFFFLFWYVIVLHNLRQKFHHFSFFPPQSYNFFSNRRHLRPKVFNICSAKGVQENDVTEKEAHQLLNYQH